MKASLITKLETLVDRHEELGVLLSDRQTINDQQKFRHYAKEYAELEPIVNTFKAYQQALREESDIQSIMAEQELQELATQELAEIAARIAAYTQQLQILLLPKDPHDDKNIFLEIRAGTGGDEAAIFAGDLARMYLRYAEAHGWHTEIVSQNSGEHGGFKEIIIKITGKDVYVKLKFESGAHRVQRVPATESQGRIHTSACTVAVLPEVTALDEIMIDPSDLKIDTYRSSGAGGQHVNKTESAIRITHIPTGTVVECQDNRSQHKNRAQAMSLLQARLLAAEQSQQQRQQAEVRKNLVGSGDRSERIRTYNFPQGRVTDHRINLTLYQLEEIMQGHLDQVIAPLLHEYQAAQLASLDPS